MGSLAIYWWGSSLGNLTFELLGAQVKSQKLVSHDQRMMKMLSRGELLPLKQN